MRLLWGPCELDGVQFKSSITDLEMATLLGAAQGGHVLEIGSAYGYGTCAMARVAKSVISVDPHQGYGAMPGSFGALVGNIQKLALEEKITVLVGKDTEILPGMLDDGRRFDLVFVDGDHRRAAALYDMNMGWSLLRGGGTMAVHDYDEATCQEVKPAVHEWLADRVARSLPGSDTDLIDTLWTIRK